MYFPYFRGRKFGIIALWELINKNLLISRVLSVLEFLNKLT